LGAALPYELRGPWLRLGPLEFTNLELLLALTLALWGCAVALERLGRGNNVTSARRSAFPLAWPLVAWLGMAFVSAGAAPELRAPALKFAARLAAGAAASWLAFDLTDEQGRPAQLGAALALGGLSVGVVGLLEIANVGLVQDWLLWFRAKSTLVGNLVRVTATLSYANTAAMVLELTLPLALAWTITTRRKPARWLLAAGVGIGLTALVLTLSRAGLGAMLFALLGLAGMAMWHRAETGMKQVVKGALLATLTVVGVAVGAASVNPLLGQRLTLDDERDWYRASYTAPDILTLDPGQTAHVPVTIQNAGSVTWLAGGEHPVVLGHRLLGEEGEIEGPRTPLPTDLPPGESATVEAVVTAPEQDGVYTVQWDLVEEGITLFGAKSGTVGRTTLRVGDAPTTAEMPPPQPEPPIRPGRMELWAIAVRMAAEHPLLGIGPDNFRHVYGAYVGATNWDVTVHANNLYLEILATMGVLGLLSFGWLAGTLLSIVARDVMRRPGRISPENSITPSGLNRTMIWQLAGAASLAAWFAHGLLDYFYPFLSTALAFWLIGGLVLRQAATRRETA
jgi:hypothetical protein